MKHPRATLGAVAVAALAASATLVAGAATGAEDSDQPGRGTAADGADGDVGSAAAGAAEGADLGTYADFSRLTERSAGQFGTGDSVAGQWSWRTEAPGEYSITWDQENPENREQFRRSADGEWLLLDGWGKRGVTYYEQRVTSERVGDADCRDMTELPADPEDGDLQHYVRWEIPAEGYCLDAEGTIQEESGGDEIRFRHRQVWSPPAPCGNTQFPDQVCITQHETWWDDNGHPYQRTLDREIQLARGLGMAFTIDQSFPEPWSAEMNNAWDY